MFDQEINNREESDSNQLNHVHPEGGGDSTIAGEPLKGSGFEREIPEEGFEWRDSQ
jgi:hypothetical protein